MPLKIPAEGHPIRELVHADKLAAMTYEQACELPTIPQARKIAADIYAKDSTATHCNVMAQSAEGRVVLVTFGRRGGYKVRWSFGRITGLQRAS